MSFSQDGVKFTSRPRKANLIFGFFVKITEAVLSVLFVISLAAPFGFPNQADAALGVSKVLSYQGRLTDASGNPLGGGSPGTTYCLRFSLYTDATVGAPDTALWPSSGTATSTSTTIINGVFNLDIPDANTFDFSTNDTPYLNVEVNQTPTSCAGSWENLAPRQRVDAVAYARVAENLYGGDARIGTGTGTTPGNEKYLKLDAVSSPEYVGNTCVGLNGFVWYNSSLTRSLVCENNVVRALSNATSTLDAVVPAGNLSVAATTISSGSVTLAGGANITLSQAGNALTIIGGAGGAGLGGIAASGIATTFTSGTVVFSGGNLMSVSTAAQAVIINNVLSSSGIAQDVASVSNAGTLSSRFALADHAHRGIGMFQISGGNTSNTSNIVYGSLAFAGGNNITLSQVSGVGGATVTIVGAAGGAAGSNTFGMSNLGNTTGTSGTINGSAVQMLFAGGNNVTLSQSINGVSGTITVSGISFANANNITFGLNAGTLTASYSQSVQTQSRFNLTLGGTNNTSAGAGYIQISSGVMTLAGGNNITLSQDGNAITIVGAAGGAGLGGIAANAASTVTNNTVVFSNSNGVSFGLNGSTMTASVAAAGGGATLSRWEYPQNQFTALTALNIGNGSLSIEHMYVPFNITGTAMRIGGSLSAATNTSATTASANMSLYMGIYTLNGSTLSLASSGSANNGFVWSQSASTTGNTSINSMRLMSVPMNINMPAGEYWVGAVISSATTYTSAGYTIYGGNQIANAATGAVLAPIGSNTTAAKDVILWQGIYTAATNAMPATIPNAAINNTSASNVLRANFYNGIVNATY